ncbi:hypothetical protein GKG03_07950 [Finegoldia sp. BIOML-A3]|uniref:hypothetical protein n=1 Tax=unclassified Finegoldia TaxID=2619637 RepID=UPI0012B145BF|nr:MULTISPECIES: hypothetical protein [unclassified Finegoldia]MSA99611.1 hypothetical protein [Finegoldia sp. BIOML-A3]MSB93597.1 hypothetical protein [Finegoldia sp. BIOML-A4]
MDDINNKVTRLEGVVDTHDDSIREMCIKIEEIEKNYDTIDRRLIVVEQNISNINTNTIEIKSDLRDLVRKREEDHYIKPIQKSEAYKDKVVMAIVSSIIAFMLGIILPKLIG